jgi:MinD superfamily P-loop ATPase
VKIAIASGKGGTGKTTVATNLAFAAARAGLRVAYVDCDAEEPNGHLFLKPQIEATRPVTCAIPAVAMDRCTLCGQCGEICQYSAIACVGEQVLVFPELCHSCGGCALVCPADAITETGRVTGRVETGRAGEIRFVQGILNVGEAKAAPVIRETRAAAPEADVTLLDAPPGTSCPVIESVRGSDFVLLVTEPTPFGLNDLKLAVGMVRALRLPFAVVINRADVGDPQTSAYCRGARIAVLGEIPDDRRIAEAYSRGVLACEALEEYRDVFARLLRAVQSEVDSAGSQARGRRKAREA